MEMNGHRLISFCYSLLAFCLISGEFGCSQQGESPHQAASPDSKNRLSAQGFGPYRIGISTRDEILGSDIIAARERFSDEGILFEFNRGKEMTGMTVMSDQYVLENGLKVGSSRRTVIDCMGEPLNGDGVVKTEKLVLDLLLYPKFSFLFDETGHVFAIRVGEGG